MPTQRIHITGASGSGTTTLGRAFAQARGIPHHDTDDYFWLPTSPPYRNKRAPADRLRLMQEMFVQRDGWVLSGSLAGWGNPLIPSFDLVILLVVPMPIRMERLRQREIRRYGEPAIEPGGARYEATQEFFDWASHYDNSDFAGRSRAGHETWLSKLPCPVLRLDGEQQPWWKPLRASFPLFRRPSRSTRPMFP